MSSLIDLLGDGISHLDLLGVESSSSQLLREGVLISETTIVINIKCLCTCMSQKLNIILEFMMNNLRIHSDFVILDWVGNLNCYFNACTVADFYRWAPLSRTLRETRNSFKSQYYIPAKMIWVQNSGVFETTQLEIAMFNYITCANNIHVYFLHYTSKKRKIKVKVVYKIYFNYHIGIV